MNMIQEQKGYHIRWIEKSIERLEEQKREGLKEININIGELQQILLESLGLHSRCDRLEDMLNAYAGYGFYRQERIDSERWIK